MDNPFENLSAVCNSLPSKKCMCKFSFRPWEDEIQPIFQEVFIETIEIDKYGVVFILNNKERSYYNEFKLVDDTFIGVFDDKNKAQFEYELMMSHILENIENPIAKIRNQEKK